MGIYFAIFLLASSVTITCALDQHFPVHDTRSQNCQTDEKFCMEFCLTTNKGTVRAQCARDLTSCICTDAFHHSVKVRFIEERQPAPPTTTSTTPPPVQYVNSHPANPQLYNPPASNQIMPQFLNCDGSKMANDWCHHFCVTDISASTGVCHPSDGSCTCQGVEPAIVQTNPITAFFSGQLPPVTPPPTTTTTVRPIIPPNAWTPITPNHPNYHGNYMTNGNDLQQGHTLNQLRFQQQQQPGGHYHYYGGNVNPLANSNGFYEMPAPTPTVLPAQQTAQHNFANINNNPIITTISAEPETPMNPTTDGGSISGDNQQVNVSTIVPEVHRHRRSAENSFTNVVSSHSYESSRKSCSISTCQDVCNRNHYNLPNCSPRCGEYGCECVCKPETFEETVDEIIEHLNHEILHPQQQEVRPTSHAHGFEDSEEEGPIGMIQEQMINNNRPRPSMTSGESFFNKRPNNMNTDNNFNKRPLMTSEDYLNMFTPPPSLHF